MQIFELMGSILLNDNGVSEQLDEIDKKAEKTDSTLQKGLSSATKWGLGLVASAGAGAVALFGMATKASEAGAEIDDISQRTNISSKSLQEFKYIAEQSGFGLETIEGSAKKLTKTMGNYAEGNKSVVDAFKELGVSATDSHGKLRTTNDVFPELISSLADMEDITKRDTLSMAIFGKSAMDMGPMLNEGSAGIEAMKIKANELGLVMSVDSIEAGAKFDDMMTGVKASMSAMVTKVGSEVLPIAQKMLEWTMAHMPQIQAIASVAFEVIGDVVKAVGKIIVDGLIPTFTKLYDWIEPYLPKIKEIAVNAFTSIGDIFKSISTFIKDNVVPIFIKMKDTFVVIFPIIKDAVMKAYDYIKPSFDKLVQTIKDSVMPIFMGLWDTVKKAMPGIKAIFEIVFPIMVALVKTVIDIITDIIKAVKGIYDFIKPSLDAVAELFSTVFGGIKKVIEGVQWVLDKFNGTSMQNKEATVTTNYKTTGSQPSIGNNANGTDYWQGGLTWVGEKGAELINLPRGSQVFDNNKSMEMARNNSIPSSLSRNSNGNAENMVQNITINADFSGVKSSDEIEKAFRNLAQKGKNSTSGYRF
jgi:phage-related protein